MKLSSTRPRVMVMTAIPETLAAFFVRQLKSLDEAGFDVHAVSSPGPVLDGLATGPGVSKHGIVIERQPSPVKDLVSLWRLFRLMRCIRPHIVHAHTPKAGLLGMAAAKLAGVPVRLYTVHGLPLLTRTGLWRRVLEAAESASASLATRTYAVSESVRELLIDLGICQAARVSVLGDGSCGGVDVERFDAVETGGKVRESVRRQYGIPADAVLITFVGRLARDKGIAVLAAAWPEVAAMVPNAHLLLAGDADVSDPVPAGVLERLRQDPSVHCIGAVSHAGVPSIYSATDIAVLPTFREGLSQMALEAGAAGVALVSTRVCGLDAVEDGITGLLVASGQVEALRHALCLLARDPGLRSQLGAAARARIAARYSAQRVNQLWMSEYRELVAAALPGYSGVLAPTGVRVGE
jgi:glycosyltransferase involved in cell wall biosynthesis